MVRFTKTIIVSTVALAAATPVAFPHGVSAPRPVLRIVDLDPLTVRGSHFLPKEGVTVNAVARSSDAPRVSRQKKAARSGKLGGFTVALTTLEVGECAVIIVTATGASGDSATAKLIPECAAR